MSTCNLRGIPYLQSQEKLERDAAQAERLWRLCSWMVEPLRELMAWELKVPYEYTLLLPERVAPGGHTIVMPKIVTIPKQVKKVAAQKAAAEATQPETTGPRQLPDISHIQGTHDKRAKFFGRKLRKLGWDEIMQLDLARQGKMLYVAPRGLLTEEMPHYEAANPVRYRQWNELGAEARLLGGMVCESQFYRHYYRNIGPVERDRVMEMDIQWMLTASPAIDHAIEERTKWELVRSSFIQREPAMVV